MKSFSKWMGRGLVPLFMLIAVSAVMSADTLPTITFEGFTPGTVNNQGGWKSTGPYDHKIVNNAGQPYSYPTFGNQSLRVSNAVASGSFGDQTFSPSVNVAAGEPGASTGGVTGAAGTTHFEASFQFASVLTTEQPGLMVTVSPDRGGDGARASFVRISDTSTGLKVEFADVQGTSAPANFVITTIATNLSRTQIHTIKFVMDFNAGPSNDVVKVYIDGNLAHTGTSWENYYRFDAEAQPEGGPRTVSAVLIRTSVQAPATLGSGLLFDNFNIMSGTPPPTVTVAYLNENPVSFWHPYSGCTGFRSLNIRNDDRNTTLTGATATITGSNAGDFVFQNGTQTQAIPNLGQMSTYAILVNYCPQPGAPFPRSATLTISGGNMANTITVNLIGS